MEKPAPSFNTQNTTSAASAATATSFSTVDNQSYPSPPSSPLHNHQEYYQDMATDLYSIYNSIFQPISPLPHSLSLTPSSSSSSSSDYQVHHNLIKLTSDAIATEHRLNQARFILEYQQLCDDYELCYARLQALIREVETLRRENNDFQLANAEMIKLLSWSTAASSRASVNRNIQREEDQVWDWNVKPKRRERPRNNNVGYNAQRNSLLKSVSVRSCSYLKVKQEQQGSSNNQQISHGVNPSLQVYVPSEATREDKAMELEVYNQGTAKTELCNKWQETGTCPYGHHCQFAHGITELRPVIRHPRYKTQVCRMVLTGRSCPYGHRCHFRHSLSDQERLLVPR